MPEAPGFEWLLAAALSVWVVAVAVHDARTGRIPNAVTGPLIGVGLLWALGQALTRGLDGGALLAGALIVSVAFGLWLSRGLGAGDVKLLLGLALFLGSWPYARTLLIAALLGTLIAIALWGRGALVFFLRQVAARTRAGAGTPPAARLAGGPRLPQAWWIAAATLVHLWWPLLARPLLGGP